MFSARFFLLVCLALVCACARGPVSERPDLGAGGGGELAARWDRFLRLSPAPAPYRFDISLRFGTQEETRRVTALFWGNSGRQLRLDVMAGVGATVARILEDGQHFLVYAPEEGKAYFYQGAERPLLQVGVPVPFNLEQLASLLNGRHAEAFGRTYARATRGPDRTGAFVLEGAPGGVLLLNGEGLPVRWREEPEGKGWTMDIAYAEGGGPLPRRLDLRHSSGKRALLLVKERQQPAPFTDAQLALNVPSHVPLLPLSQFKRSK